MIDHPPPCFGSETLPADWEGQWYHGYNIVLCRQFFPVRLYLFLREEYPGVPRYLPWKVIKEACGGDKYGNIPLTLQAKVGLSPEEIYALFNKRRPIDLREACEWMRGLDRQMGNFKYHDGDMVRYDGNTWYVEAHEHREKDPEPRYFLRPKSAQLSKRWVMEQDLRKI